MKRNVKALLGKLSDRYEFKRGEGRGMNGSGLKGTKACTGKFSKYNRGEKASNVGKLAKKAKPLSSKRRGSKKELLKEKMNEMK